MEWPAHHRLRRRRRKLRRPRSLPKKRSNSRADDSAEFYLGGPCGRPFHFYPQTSEPALISSMLGNDQRDVVVLFLRAELLNLSNNRVHRALRRKPAIAPQRFNQAPFAEFLLLRVVGFGDAISVKRERVSSAKPALANRAIPFLEDPQHGRRGLEPFQSVIAPEEQSGEMPAIRVAQTPRVVVIFGEEKRGERTVRRIFAKELVHGAQEALRLVHGNGALAAQIRLQICH